MARPPSSQPAVCNTKFTPARQVGSSVLADSYAACASGILEAHSAPPERNGTPRRRASAAMVYSTSAGSGVPKVGAPDCMDSEEAKLPRITGARVGLQRPEHGRIPGEGRVGVDEADDAGARLAGLRIGELRAEQDLGHLH